MHDSSPDVQEARFALARSPSRLESLRTSCHSPAYDSSPRHLGRSVGQSYSDIETIYSGDSIDFNLLIKFKTDNLYMFWAVAPGCDRASNLKHLWCPPKAQSRQVSTSTACAPLSSAVLAAGVKRSVVTGSGTTRVLVSEF